MSGAMAGRASGFIPSPQPGGPSVYFDRLAPAGASARPPIVMIHGGAHTGACYRLTADGRPGWADVMAARGYEVIVPDWPGCGRSGYVPSGELTGEIVCAGLGALLLSLDRPAVVMTHSMSGAYGWRLLEQYGDKIDRLVGIAPGPPGNIQDAPIVVAEGEGFVEVEKAIRMRLDLNSPYVGPPAFVKRKLIGDSTHFPWESFDAYAGTLNPVPQRLLYQRMNVRDSQLKVSDFSKFKDKGVLVMTGSADSEHPRDWDGAIVDWLNRNGARADFIFLSDRSISGNGHMIMMEDNSDALIGIVADWLEQP